MGLDMYAYSAPTKLLGDAQINCGKLLYTDDGKPKEDVNTDFAYWRKFSALHDWMHTLYENKGGTGDFNCQQVRLMPEDIDNLEIAAKIKTLRPVAGFFFGNDEGFTDEDRDDVLLFVNSARGAFACNHAVIYDSWW